MNIYSTTGWYFLQYNGRITGEFWCSRLMANVTMWCNSGDDDDGDGNLDDGDSDSNGGVDDNDDDDTDDHVDVVADE